MACVYSQFIGIQMRDGVQHTGARCPHCLDVVWFPTYAKDRRNPPQDSPDVSAQLREGTPDEND